jgi:tRNA G46 methylase TrmB
MEVSLSENFIKSMSADLQTHKDVSTEDYSVSTSIYFDKQHYYVMLKELEKGVGDLQNKKVLEIGSGYGMLCAIANKEFNYDFYGIEPTKFDAGGRFDKSYLLSRENEIV